MLHAEINEGPATFALALLAQLRTFTSSMKRAGKVSEFSDENEAVVFRVGFSLRWIMIRRPHDRTGAQETNVDHLP